MTITQAELNVVIGKNIRKYRKLNNLSTSDMAGMLGISEVFLHLVENGRRGMKISRLLKACGIFGIDISALFKVDEPVAQPEAYERIVSMTEGLEESQQQFVLDVLQILRKYHQNLDGEKLDLLREMMEFYTQQLLKQQKAD